MPFSTSFASAPTRSQILAISFANPILVARKEFDPYLIISALVSVVMTSGTRPGALAARGRNGGAGNDLLDQRLVQLRAGAP